MAVQEANEHLLRYTSGPTKRFFVREMIYKRKQTERDLYSHLRPFPSSSIKVRRRHSFHLFFQHWISYSIFPFNSSARKVNGKKRQNSYDDRCLPDLFFLLPTSFWPLPPVFKRVTHYLLYKKEEKIRYEIILRAKKKKKKKW